MSKTVKYDRHEEEWDKYLNDNERSKVALTWLQQDDTLDRWRHNRMYRLVEPIIQFSPLYKWLTIGDGRYGTDANALMRMGAENVFCSDISDKLLKIGNECGFIKKYAAENAEQLSFDDAQFDFVLCKEAYHHFPRPHIALHEMLRVSKVGVVLIEPNDAQISRAPLRFLITLVKRLLGRKVISSEHSFETVGNYVFSISKRELEKVQLGMHRRFVAYNYINDYYEPGFEFIRLDTTKKSERNKIFKAKILIFLRDLMTRLGLVSSGLLVSILFKKQPDEMLLSALRGHRWEIKELPRNPYL